MTERRRQGQREAFAWTGLTAVLICVALGLAFARTPIEQALGAAVVSIALADVFLTVLYARMDTGILSHAVTRATWGLFRAVSRPFGRRRGAVLSFCGPCALVLLVLLWALTLTIGTAMILHPGLGSSIRSTHGTTPTDFASALFAAGSSISVVGSSDFTPHTSGYRLLYLFNSLVGMSVMSLTLTYLMQVYTALQRRNALGLQLHLAAKQTTDAAELLAGLGPEGDFRTGYTIMAELASSLAMTKESHHFYPVLFYFRFPRPFYSVSSICLLSLDAVTLIDSALDDERYLWLRSSAAVTQLREASLWLMTSLEDTFLPGGRASLARPDARERDRWQKRYDAALARLRAAHIPTTSDERAGAERYASLRAEWDRHVEALSGAMGYSLDDIDPVARSRHAAIASPIHT